MNNLFKNVPWELIWLDFYYVYLLPLYVMMDTHWHLSEKDFFYGIPSEKEEFISLSLKRNIKKNQFIFFEEELGDSAFYVEQGVIRVFKSSLIGKETTVFIRRAGEMFGLAEVIGGKSRACNAQAITGCVLYEIKKQELEFLLSRHYSIAKKIMEVMGRRLRYLGEQIENLTLCDVSTRLLKLLLYLSHNTLVNSGAWDEPVTVPVRLTQEQIAAMIGSCQQTVCETLKHLQEDGLIRVRKKEIILLRPVDLLKGHTPNSGATVK